MPHELLTALRVIAIVVIFYSVSALFVTATGKLWYRWDHRHDKNRPWLAANVRTDDDRTTVSVTTTNHESPMLHIAAALNEMARAVGRLSDPK